MTLNQKETGSVLDIGQIQYETKKDYFACNGQITPAQTQSSRTYDFVCAEHVKQNRTMKFIME
jgi:hypothetical protein